VDNDKEKLLRSRPWAAHQDSEDRVESLNPELAEFKVRTEKFNTRIRDELTGVPVPADLRDRILAGHKVLRVSFWQRTKHLLPIAAALVFLGAGLFYWLSPREDRSIAGFRSRMVGFAVREYRMDLLTNNLADLKTFLALKGRPADFTLPSRLSATPLKGGASLSWWDKRVSMVCFDGGGGETLYMFILPEEHKAFREPKIEKVKGLATATWAAEGKTFVLAGKLSEGELARLVKS
jgi:hypothetical protein